MTPETAAAWQAWAAVAQAVLSAGAILASVLIVQHSHRLQLRAERKRELRQLGLEHESWEKLFAETALSIKVAAARKQAGETVEERWDLPDAATIDQALVIAEGALGRSPHLARPFVRGRHAAREAIRLVHKSHGFDGRLHPFFEKHLETLEAVTRELRDAREAYMLESMEPDPD